MTTIVLIIFIILLLIIIIGLGFLIRWWWGRRVENEDRLNWMSIFALVVALLLISFSFAAPFIFTRDAASSDFDFTSTGQIGDTIGGIMNPFVALAGVIITGLAFYMQYNANLLQRELFNKQLKKEKQKFKKQIEIDRDHFQKQIDLQVSQNRLQKFEAQFYEMVRLHKENVNEIELPAKRKIVARGEISYEDYYITKRNAFVEFKNEFESILEAISKSDLKSIDDSTFKKAYEYFFWGLESEYEDSEEEVDFQDIHHENKSLAMVLSSIKNAQLSERLADIKGIELNFNIVPFNGHSGLLGHYFRHLFFTVKFVVKQDILSYKNKIKYLKILRAQLSNHEQIMLFYNWLSGYGKAWENEDNKFFTDYRMIHNLWYNKMSKEKYVQEKVAYLASKKSDLRKGNMFEIDG